MSRNVSIVLTWLLVLFPRYNVKNTHVEYSGKIRENLSLSLSFYKNIMEVENNVYLREGEKFTDPFRWKCKRVWWHLLTYYDVLIKT